MTLPNARNYSIAVEETVLFEYISLLLLIPCIYPWDN